MLPLPRTEGCSVSLVPSRTGSHCVQGTSFGCYADARKMWVRPPCRGRFRCDGYELQCQVSARSLWRAGVHNCSCYEAEALQPDGSVAAILVPDDLSVSRLVEGDIRQPRFVPNSTEEILHAAFTYWNVLDRVMLEHSHSNWQTGYMREIQLRRMVRLVQETRASTYCEVGMNGGHSAAAMLHASPSLTVHSFDMMNWNYSWPVVRLLSTTFSQRFFIHPGDSRQTVPQWTSGWTQQQRRATRTRHATGAGPCELILVDGDHTLKGAVADLRNMRALAAPSALVVVDDIAVSPGVALSEMVREGAMRVRESYGPYDPPSRFNRCLRTYNRGFMCLPWGFSVAEYTS